MPLPTEFCKLLHDKGEEVFQGEGEKPTASGKIWPDIWPVLK